MKRPFGVLAENATADFALLLLEPVRSAEAARNSIGIAAAIASMADLTISAWRYSVASPAAPSCGRAAPSPAKPAARAGSAARTRRACGCRVRRSGPATPRARWRRGCWGGAPCLQHIVGYGKRFKRNAELFLGALEFVGAERLAMGLRGAGPRRCAVADGGLAGDQRRLAGFLRAGDRGRNRLLILAVDQLGRPART